jgi:hypothetical protein
MKPIIYRNPYLIPRITVSVILQAMLVVLLRNPARSTAFDLGILGIALMAYTLLCPQKCLEIKTKALLWLLSLWPGLVFLAVLLSLLGWNALHNWLLRVCAGL